MFGFKKQISISAMMFFSCNLPGVNSLSALLKCISVINQKHKTRPEIININSDEPVFYPFSIKTSKCSGSCNNMNDPYAKLCVPDVAKNSNIRGFNLSRTNEIRRTE